MDVKEEERCPGKRDPTLDLLTVLLVIKNNA